jgi:hypothetical protein
MKSDYWNVTDEQVIEKTGKDISYWMKLLKQYDKEQRPPSDFVGHLQKDHGIPRYWARTLTTRYLKTAANER